MVVFLGAIVAYQDGLVLHACDKTDSMVRIEE